MLHRGRTLRLTAAALVLFGLFAPAFATQDKKDEKKKKELPKGEAVTGGYVRALRERIDQLVNLQSVPSEEVRRKN